MAEAVFRRHFGTDGIRGPVGTGFLTADGALKVANAAARVLAPNGGKALIGKDTRISGYMFESALEAGLVAAGVDALLIGPLPTPGIAYMTKFLGCDFAIVISASHNPYDDNGIKFFSKDGEKVTDAQEAAIEALLAEPPVTVTSLRLGRAERVDSMRAEYQKFCLSTLDPNITFAGMKLIMDGANGAAYKVAPRTLTALGADVTAIGVSPNGTNINDRCGATDPALLSIIVRDTKADAGIAFDGDGDRLIMVDAAGNIVDGDQILYLLAKSAQAAGTLQGPVVGTIESNIGLEHALKDLGIEFKRANVGDRHVFRMLRETGGNLGAEPSGHILMLHKTTTGDALIAALQVLAVMKETGKTLAELIAPLVRSPHVLVNVKVTNRFDPLGDPGIRQAIQAAETSLGQGGRVVVRASGTESLIRVSVEAADETTARREAEQVATAVRAVSP